MRQDVGVDGDAQRLSQLCWMFFLKIIDDQDQQLEVMQDNYQSPIPEKFQRDWDQLLAAIRTLLPQRVLPTINKLAREIDAVLAEFLRGQLTVMLALAAIYTSGLWLVGLDSFFQTATPLPPLSAPD